MEEFYSLRIKKSMVRNQAHFFFDKIWENKLMTRDEAYTWLSKQLNIDIGMCHFSRMNRTMIVESINLSINYLNERYLHHDLPKYRLL